MNVAEFGRADDETGQAPTGGGLGDEVQHLVVAGEADDRSTSASALVPNGYFAGPDDEPDRFELVGAALEGGEGLLWRGHYRGAGMQPITYAIKQLRPPAGAGPGWPTRDDVTRWQDQRFLLQSLRSDHIVAVTELFFGPPPHSPGAYRVLADAQEFRLPYLVMEWVEGPTLGEVATDPAVGLDARLALLRDLAVAVDSLHSRTQTSGNPVLHRDIKPVNCIAHATRGTVLVDVGTLRRIDDGADALGLHTRRYAAPEVLADLTAARTVASDLYSLGAVGWTCLVGTDPPVATQHGVQDALRVEALAAALRLGAAQPDVLVDVLLTMLDADPDARPTRPVRWAEELLAAAAPPAEEARKARSRRRRRRVGMAVTAAFLVLGLVVAWSVVTRPEVPGLSAAAADDFTPFGTEYAEYEHIAADGSLGITPPLGDNAFDHLWGFYQEGQHCAASVAFDLEVSDYSAIGVFGIGVAPRSQLTGDQPSGMSVQYEWTAASATASAGSYIRPTELPGGAWSGADQPEPAPDLRGRHHVEVDAVGTLLSVDVDGERVVSYEVPAVECGGVAIRAWGATFSLTNVETGGT